ncbi:MAG: hypothetical protein WC068_11545 [Caulobacter sp.]
MRHSKPIGTPFARSSSDQIDEWSREIFDALSDWAEAHDGRWTRWEPGYLLLEIATMNGEGIDPILIDSSDEELTVEFGYWETHLPDRESNAAGAAREAIELTSQWLSGEIRTAVFTDVAGKWCGSMIVEEDDAVPPKPSEGMAFFHPTSVEVRGPRKSEWRTFSI